VGVNAGTSKPSIAAPLILLPPSEGKATGGTGRVWSPDDGAFGALADRRRDVVAALATAGGGSEKLLGVKGDHLARGLAANRSLLQNPSLPAWQRYTGVVWDHLAPDSLPAASRRRIVVVSGLLGVVRGDDPVPEYRLRMGVSLAPLGKLSTWWRAEVSAALERIARGRLVVDLLPQEHRAALLPDIGLRGVTVGLVDPSGKPGGHFAKAAKGRLARMVLCDGVDAIDRWVDDRFELTVSPFGSGA